MSSFFRRHLFLLVLALLSALSLAGALALQERSFPVATVQFNLLREDAEREARSYLTSLGYPVDDYRAVVAFEVDEPAKNYLQRQTGLSGLNRLAAEEVVVWQWHVRFFRELQQEEYNVYITPDGRLAGFARTIPESDPGASLDGEEAETIARSFLAASGHDLEAYRPITGSLQRRDARVDHSFTWERVDFRVGEATSRVDVWLQGDRVGGFREYVKLPEAWLRDQAVEANRGGLLANAGWTLTFGLELAMILLALMRLRAGGIHWRFAFGLAATVGIVTVAVGLNSLPLLLMGYPTTASLVSYIVGQVQGMLGQLVTAVLGVVLAGIAGGWLYAETFRRRLPPHLLFSRAGPASPEFVTALVVGYLVAGVWLGYVTAFYTVAGELFGAWSPAEVPYQDLMSTLVPALYPLTVGLSAAVSEEFTFRMFAVPLLLWLGGHLLRRWRWTEGRNTTANVARIAVGVVAVTLPAAIWGSLHATYPLQPFYIRAVELTLLGTVSGLIMMRFGILATITSHYVYNASVVGGLFLLSGNPYLQASAVMVGLLPLLLLLPAAGRRLRGLPLTSAVTPPGATLETPVVPARATVPDAAGVVPGQARLLPLVLLGVLALVVSVAWQVPRLGDGARLAIGRDEARASADRFAAELGFAPEEWLSVTSFEDWSVGSHTTYLLRRLGTGGTNDILSTELPSYLWQTRYFKSLEREELVVRFDQQGRFHSFDRRLPEEQPGANLSLAEARAVAEAFVREQGRADMLAHELVTATSVERVARTDHVFEWEDTAGRIDEAAFRLRVAVKGDEVGEYRLYLKVPEAFERELARTGDLDAVLSLAKQGLPAAVFVIGIILFVWRFRNGLLNLRFAAITTALMAGLAVAGEVNRLPALAAGYWTTIEYEGFYAWHYTVWLRGLLADLAWYFVLFALAESLYRECFPRLPSLGRLAATLLRPGRESFAAGATALCLVPVFWLLLAVYRAAREWLAPGTLAAEATVPGALFDAASASLAVVQGNLSFAVWVGLGASAITLWLWRRLRRPWLVAAVWAAALTVLYMARPEEAVRVLVEAGRWAATVAVFYALAVWFRVSNVWVYVLSLYTFFSFRDALFLVAQPHGPLALAGVVGLLFALLPAVILVALGLRAMRRRMPLGDGEVVTPG